MQALIFFMLMVISTHLNAQPLSASQMRSEYFAMKRSMSPLFKFEMMEFDKEKKIVVYDCGFTEGVDYLQSEHSTENFMPDWVVRMHLLSKSVVQLRNAAIFAKYPDDAWRSALTEQEDAWLNLIILHALKRETTPPNVNYLDSLIDKMNWYRLKNGLNLPALLSQDGCGAGESQALIKTIPAASSIRFIPEFFAKICEATGRDNPGACPYWVDVPDTEIAVSGLYRYIVVWAGSPARRGVFDFDKLLVGNEVKIIEIRK